MRKRSKDNSKTPASVMPDFLDRFKIKPSGLVRSGVSGSRRAGIICDILYDNMLMPYHSNAESAISFLFPSVKSFPLFKNHNLPDTISVYYREPGRLLRTDYAQAIPRGSNIPAKGETKVICNIMPRKF